jgi:hypothetical protein
MFLLPISNPIHPHNAYLFTLWTTYSTTSPTAAMMLKTTRKKVHFSNERLLVAVAVWLALMAAVFEG